MTIQFMYDNFVENSTFFYNSSAKTGFPSSNLKHPFRTKKWVTSATTGRVVFGRSTKYDANCVVISDYDWTSQPSTLKIQMHTSTDFSGGGTTAVNLASLWTRNPSTLGNNAVIIKTFTTEKYRYFRLICGHGSSFGIGKVFIGTKFQPTDNYLAEGIETEYIDPSKIDTSIDGQEHVDELTRYREKDISFFVNTLAQWNKFQEFINTAGIRKDLYIRFSTDSQDDTWYCKIARSPKATREPPSFYKLKLQFKESR